MNDDNYNIEQINEYQLIIGLVLCLMPLSDLCCPDGSGVSVSDLKGISINSFLSKNN